RAEATLLERGAPVAEDARVFRVENDLAGPTAAIDGPSSVKKNKDATFDGSPSSDPDGFIVDWTWDLGDGTAAEGATVTHRYRDTGTYEVTLTVTDNDGLKAVATHTVVVHQGNGNRGG
ncbi:MAG TPA: PKD domain-containing protein, partial [Candidatus Thermoplasmatota archaeon]|nr:PKD domain-containing protein [Candidatus Thermoplasmatota archaeon]